MTSVPLVVESTQVADIAPHDAPLEAKWHGSYDEAASRQPPEDWLGSYLSSIIFAEVFRATCGVALFTSLVMRGDWYWLALESYLMLLATHVLHSIRTHTGKTTKADESLLMENRDSKAAFVELQIWQAGGLTGSDHGFLWIEENRLLFSGHRTSFALAPTDARSTSVRARKSRIRFSLSEKPQVTVQLQVIQSAFFEVNESGDLMVQIVGSFLHSGKSSLLPSQLPPLKLDPQFNMGTSAWFLLEAVLFAPIAVIAGLGAYLLGYTILDELAQLECFAIGIMLAVVLGAAITCVRAALACYANLRSYIGSRNSYWRLRAEA